MVLGVTAPTVIKWVESGRVAALKTPGGHRRIARSELARLAREAGRPLSDEVESGQLKILVVDAEADFADMVAEFLNLQTGLDAVAAFDPVEVGFEIGRWEPNVVLCVADMSSGFLRSMARHLDRSKTRLIVMVNGQSRHKLSDLDDLGADCILEKPIKLDQLLKLIQN